MVALTQQADAEGQSAGGPGGARVRVQWAHTCLVLQRTGTYLARWARYPSIEGIRSISWTREARQPASHPGCLPAWLASQPAVDRSTPVPLPVPSRQPKHPQYPTSPSRQPKHLPFYQSREAEIPLLARRVYTMSGRQKLALRPVKEQNHPFEDQNWPYGQSGAESPF